MSLIHHAVTGNGRPSVVFVHGFACSHSDWDAQVAHMSPRHKTVALDLRGHGASPGTPDQCSIEQYGADVAELMRALDLSPAVLVGHSMGCRVVVDAALQAPTQTAAVVLVDGSHFAPSMEATLKSTFAASDGYPALVRRWFEEMFTSKSCSVVVARVVKRAGKLPRPIGEKMLLDLVRYDSLRLATSLARLHVPVLEIQSTYSTEKRERRSMTRGQTTPYLDMLRVRCPAIRIEVIPDTGHFPQIDEAAQVNALMDDFITKIVR
jgi:pimeloyl-ACP methyl ester carboxylesterase